MDQHARNRIRDVIVCARCVVDAVPAAASCPALEAAELSDETR
jgi:hypothetical protein